MVALHGFYPLNHSFCTVPSSEGLATFSPIKLSFNKITSAINALVLQGDMIIFCGFLHFCERIQEKMFNFFEDFPFTHFDGNPSFTIVRTPFDSMRERPKSMKQGTRKCLATL